MAAGFDRRKFQRRLACLLTAFAMILPALLFAVPDSVAQEQPEPRRNFFQRLFMGNDSPPPQPRRVQPAKPRAKATKARPKRPSEPQEPEVAIVEKLADARVLLVVGDFLGGGLAEGLSAAYAQNPNVRVLDRTNGSSGFVREDYFNWPEEIKAMLETENPAAIVVMIGSNDRQQMLVGETRENKLTDAWTKEYEARAAAFAKTIRERNIPLLWVGMPAFKSSSMTSDMLAFNDIYRDVAEDTKGEFIDIWDGFVDENGAFVISGPDMNGQPVRLRSGDGINVTKAGRRKLAFYVEKPLGKILGGAATPAIGTFGSEIPPSAMFGPMIAPSIDRTQPVSLNDPDLDGGSELLGQQVTPKGAAHMPGERLAIEGVAPEGTPGRVDDFTLPQMPPVIAIPALSEQETTSAIRR